jgi:hypothetical protein
LQAKLCFMGHALMENRNGLVVDGLFDAPWCGHGPTGSTGIANAAGARSQSACEHYYAS